MKFIDASYFYPMTKKYRLEIKHEAIKEIEDAYYYYEEKQTGLGHDFKTALDETFSAILKAPSGFIEVANNRRQIVVNKFPYVVIYEIFASLIVVYAVFHTSLNPKKKIR